MQVTQFNFDKYQVRTLRHDDGEIWFVAQDVCEALTIENSRDAMARLDSDEKGVGTIDTLGGPQVKNERGEWALTSAGQKHGESLPYTKRGHSGFQILWRESVIDLLQA